MLRVAIVEETTGRVVNVNVRRDPAAEPQEQRAKWERILARAPEGCVAIRDDTGIAEPGGHYDARAGTFAPAPAPAIDRSRELTLAVEVQAKIDAADRLAADIPEAAEEATRLRAQLVEIKARIAAAPIAPLGR